MYLERVHGSQWADTTQYTVTYDELKIKIEIYETLMIQKPKVLLWTLVSRTGVESLGGPTTYAKEIFEFIARS